MKRRIRLPGAGKLCTGKLCTGKLCTGRLCTKAEICAQAEICALNWNFVHYSGKGLYFGQPKSDFLILVSFDKLDMFYIFCTD
uniref:Uncharacterized protein n=1 Tax=Meloidogyne enterolobii TaxID=390850 RepID=A0A6V7WDQ8_MELEN|nr:unnamed protein product [Meloidogyne enterolobii]